MEELAQYDPNLVVGILGGSAGTTYDAFRLIHDAQKYGARVALFGRKINNAEHQLAFIEMLRLITDGKLSPEEAVRAYHGVLQAKSIKPRLAAGQGPGADGPGHELRLRRRLPPHLSSRDPLFPTPRGRGESRQCER